MDFRTKFLFYESHPIHQSVDASILLLHFFFVKLKDSWFMASSCLSDKSSSDPNYSNWTLFLSQHFYTSSLSTEFVFVFIFMTTVAAWQFRDKLQVPRDLPREHTHQTKEKKTLKCFNRSKKLRETWCDWERKIVYLMAAFQSDSV